ncbi:hypothetical protein FHS72_003536 [Loktanella ponticola]|uniref:Fungal lipase-like domain-containing protein n=1 Tax=Yoonia ponticola TaxID=1524255 RepID=A0A7W9BNR0_9RHOB|nr:lipase family protein [Yoonia ponticola]MBB5723889.1 hypothetical protein [Yoonia ponticola]
MNSTQVKGEATDKVCLDFATFMLLDNYEKDPALLQPECATAMQEIDRNWDRVNTANIGTPKRSGFYATMYTPKDGNDCPPTLAVRGTVFSDARGIAFMKRTKVYPEFAPEKSQEFAFGWAPGYKIDEEDEDPSTLTSLGYMARKFGFIQRLTQSGNWLELFATQQLNTTTTSRIQVIPPNVIIPDNYRHIIIEETYEVWMNRDEGDWATNVIQGIGKETLQYGTELTDAVNEAMIEAEKFGKQLRITGHSLGGGLASAAAIYAKKIDPEYKIYGLAYDAAGVHEQTAERLRTSLNLASEAKIIMRAVEDEILTSLEKESDFVPIFSSLVRFTGSEMPSPIGAFDIRRGISPGPIGNSWAEGKTAVIKGHEYAPKWARMPNLLEIGSQSLFPNVDGRNPMVTWSNFAGHFAGASNMDQALDNLHNEIQSRVRSYQNERDQMEQAEVEAERESETADTAREAAAERLEAEREAASEAEEAAAEERARAVEAQAEANEPKGLLGYLYNRYYDDPRDNVRTIGQGLREIGDEVGDLGSALGDEILDAGREVIDEAGDGINNVTDAVGDGLNYAYEHTAQYMVEFGKYTTELTRTGPQFFQIILAVAAYHDTELLTFTFAIDR